MDALKNVGNFFQGNQGAVSAGLGGAGLIGNLLNSNKQNSYLDQQLKLQKQDIALSNNPTELNRRAAAFEHPLDQGLVSGVGNAVQGQLAERGLGASPNIMAEVLAQALAPAKQQNQSTAIEELFRSLGLPFQGQRPQFPQNTNLTSLLQGLFKPGAGANGQPPPQQPVYNGGGIPSDNPNLSASAGGQPQVPTDYLSLSTPDVFSAAGGG